MISPAAELAGVKKSSENIFQLNEMEPMSNGPTSRQSSGYNSNISDNEALSPSLSAGSRDHIGMEVDVDVNIGEDADQVHNNINNGNKALTDLLTNADNLRELDEGVDEKNLPIKMEPSSLDSKVHKDGEIHVEKFVGTHILKQILESEPSAPLDTVLSCSDGRIAAHRVIIIAASPFMKSVLRDHKLGQVATIILPDVSVQVMTLILHLIYTGQMVYPPELQDEIYEAMQCLMIGQYADFTLKSVKLKPISEPREISASEAPETLASPEVSGEAKENEESGSEEEDEDAEIINQQRIKEVAKCIIAYKADGDGETQAFHCTLCESSMIIKQRFITHSSEQHKKEFKSVEPTLKEIEELYFCVICNKQFGSISQAENCLKTHSLARCYACFSVLKQQDLVDHYRVAHGLKSKLGLVAKCRWCDAAVVISGTGMLLRRHAQNIHLQKAKKLLSIQKNKPGNVKPNPVRTEVPTSSSNLTSNLKTRTKKQSIKLEKNIIPLTPEILPAPPMTPQTPNKQRSVLQFFQKTQKIKENDIEKPSSNSNPKRKLDSDGKPLQLAKRTGIPVGQLVKRKMLKPSMKYKQGTFLLEKNPETGNIPTRKIKVLPKVHVHLELLNNININQFSKKKSLSMDSDRVENSTTTAADLKSDIVNASESNNLSQPIDQTTVERPLDKLETSESPTKSTPSCT